MLKDNIVKNIFGNAFWSILGTLFSKGSILLSSIIVARILGQTLYGELGLIRSTVNMFVVFASFGLGLTATKYISELKKSNKERVSKIIGLMYIFSSIVGLIITVSIIIGSSFIVEQTINAPHLKKEIIYGGLMLFFSSINGAQIGILNGFEEFKKIAIVNLIVGILSFPIQIICAYFFGLSGAVIGFGLNFVLLWILNYFTVRKVLKQNYIYVSFKGVFKEFNVLFKFSLPALLSGLLVTPVMWVCNVLLVNNANGYNEMAIYDVSNQWKNIVLMLPAAMSSVILPMLSSSRRDPKKYKKVFSVNLLLSVSVSIVLTLILVFLSKNIMSFYGQEYVHGRSVLIILLVSTIFMTYNGVIGQAIASLGMMWLGFLLNLIWGVSLISLSYYFLSKGLGALGLSYGFLISYIIHSFSQSVVLLYLRKNEG